MTAIAIPKYSYSSILNDAAKITWRVQDLIGADKPLDFTKLFLPEAIAHTRAISCLAPDEQLTLNHIRGNSLPYWNRWVTITLMSHIGIWRS